MQASRLALRRAPRRPLRPPSLSLQSPASRPFTHNSQLLILARSVGPRPQLPFLHPPSVANASLRRRQPIGQWQIARLLTTERKKYIKEQVWLAGKWTAFLWTSAGLLFIAAFGVQNELLERQTPSPREWSAISRMNYRSARAQEDPEFWPSGMTDWASTGSMYKDVLDRLEDPSIDGAGTKDQDEGGLLVPGVGKAGLDVSAKSEAWRRGYHEVLMGCAKAAEHLEGWVKDTTRRISFPPEVVIGPSNPNPRPCPPYAHEAPLEENCVPAFAGPETFYMKVITTKGFSTSQRLDAALAYAEWLDTHDLPSSAAEMYKWSFDIATAAVEDASDVVDTTTGIIRDSPGAAGVSPNITRAATALATHYARQQEVNKALPIFLSVLRARHNAPLSRGTDSSASLSRPASSGVVGTLRSIIMPPSYPPPPPTGDEPLSRTPGTICDDAALKTYIGEILFATSSSSRDKGLSWTRDAIADAESGVSQDNNLNAGEKERCAQCLEIAVGNLEKMAGVMAREEKAQREAKRSSWWGGKQNAAGPGEWETEHNSLQERVQKLKLEGLRERFARAGNVTGGTWIG
ncbi:mfs maltose permease [Diplodia corticola]|uniref:Mfs maltose permease n=1 Tax=Diplodia corticola TaxID=236234 RepID=A0A1J9RAH0_9PEZI|nr:mfs maltose permease [Diplodia corticola]OJD37465.1 mfs maltose permease [Diplodia corticola]